MAYCTQSDILNQITTVELIQLTDDAVAGVINTTIVARAIADADAEIDGYLGSRHVVPLTTVPAIVLKISVDLSIFNLYSRRGTIPDIRADRYKNAIRFLEQVGQGKISLGASDPGGNPPESNAPEMSGSNPERSFTRSTLESF